MDKQALLEKINKANISSELRAQLVEMVNASPEANQELLNKIGAAIDNEAETLIEEIANTEVQMGTDKYNKQLDEIETDINAFGKELNKKVDEIDMQDARSKLG